MIDDAQQVASDRLAPTNRRTIEPDDTYAEQHFPNGRSLHGLHDNEVNKGHDGNDNYLEYRICIQMSQPVLEHMGSITLGSCSISTRIQAHNTNPTKDQALEDPENDHID